MATLATVTDYVSAARVLLQDNVVPFNYPDAHVLLALNIGLAEVHRLRTDLFFSVDDVVPSFAAVDTTAVSFDIRYRSALLYFIVGWLQLRNGDGQNDDKAASLIKLFQAQIVGGAV